MGMALEGVRVLDLSSMWAAPGAGMYLADQGADVIKVEPPGGGDARRLFTHPNLGNESPSFLLLNRSKRGIVLDLRKPEGQDIARRLAAASDVLIHNFRSRVAERLRLAYGDLEPINPRLVYVALSAYGKKGPYAERRGYDLILQAMSGMMHRQLPDGTPIGAGIWAADSSTPMLLAYGVALALLQRERTGRGQQVETSLLEAAVAMQAVDMVKPQAERGAERAPANQATFAPYRASDGRWLLSVVLSDKEFASLVEALELPHLADDPRYASQQARSDHREELFGLLEGIFSTRSRDEWLRHLEDHDVPCAPILARDDVYDSPQVTANGVMTELAHPTAGPTKMMNIPLRLSANPANVRRHSPLQGEHTDEVLGELGYSEADIARLREAAVVA